MVIFFTFPLTFFKFFKNPFFSIFASRYFFFSHKRKKSFFRNSKKKRVDWPSAWELWIKRKMRGRTYWTSFFWEKKDFLFFQFFTFDFFDRFWDHGGKNYRLRSKVVVRSIDFVPQKGSSSARSDWILFTRVWSPLNKWTRQCMMQIVFHINW